MKRFARTEDHKTKTVIDSQEIQDKSREFGINPNNVEKDYVHGWILNAIQTQSTLRNHLTLKGGNGLRKAYLASTRFSKDLDFSCQQHLDQALLARELRTICEFVEQQAQVHFATERTVLKSKDLPGIDAVEARLYFKGFYGEEDILLKVQLDVTEFEKIYLPIQWRPLIHPYSDGAECATSIQCQKIEEILASKLTTLLHRRKAIDLFDLLYSIVFTREFSIDRLQVITTFLKKSIFEPQPSVARDQLLAVPLEEFRPLWSAIVAPIRSLFDFDYVLGNLRSLIESLFSFASQPARVAGIGPTFPTSRTSLRSISRHPIYFSWDARNVIVTAGRSRTLVELTYDGFRRLIEPYRIEYYVRKSDGIGSEYFWGFDHTGGKSGHIGMKQFFCSKIKFARATDLIFCSAISH
jgi:predicted nucleotidyltransferase component of viral defense system